MDSKVAGVYFIPDSNSHLRLYKFLRTIIIYSIVEKSVYKYPR